MAENPKTAAREQVWIQGGHNIHMEQLVAQMENKKPELLARVTRSIRTC
jgi:hypothetical protein